MRKHSAKRVMRVNAMLQRQKVFQPRFLALGKQRNILPTLSASNPSCVGPASAPQSRVRAKERPCENEMQRLHGGNTHVSDCEVTWEERLRASGDASMTCCHYVGVLI